MGIATARFRDILKKKTFKSGWIIEGKLATSGRLMTRLQLAWVIKHGIKSVITILEIPLHEKWFEGCAGVEYRHLQVEVYGAPPLDQTVDIIDYIDSKIEDDKPVIVLCNGGTGRTGTILSAYRMKKFNLTAEQATEKIKQIRGKRPRREKQLIILAEDKKTLLNNEVRLRTDENP